MLVAFSQDFDSYKDAEKCRSQHGGTEAQMLLRQPDYATLSLRIDPATVSIEQRGDSTWLTIDSANFPGTTGVLLALRSSCGPKPDARPVAKMHK